jgi:hypothetical protein
MLRRERVEKRVSAMNKLLKALTLGEPTQNACFVPAQLPVAMENSTEHTVKGERRRRGRSEAELTKRIRVKREKRKSRRIQ